MPGAGHARGVGMPGAVGMTGAYTADVPTAGTANPARWPLEMVVARGMMAALGIVVARGQSNGIAGDGGKRRKQQVIRALYSAASGMNAQQTNVDNIAHNLANANTVGFKMRRAQFQDLLYQNVIQPGAGANAQALVPTGLQIGLGTRVVSNQILFNQGNFTMTSNPNDLVIEGNGFFAVRQLNGQIGFTRAGNFHLDRDGNMVTPEGNLLDPPIVIPSDGRNVYIAPDGIVTYSMPGQTSTNQAGQILLATFQNPAGLNNLGKNLLVPTDASGEPIFGQPGGAEGAGTLLQGYLEQSNVSLVEEFIGLISSQRAYEANAKVVRAADEMYQQLNNLGR